MYKLITNIAYLAAFVIGIGILCAAYEYIVPYLSLVWGIEAMHWYLDKNKKTMHWVIWAILGFSLYFGPIYIMKANDWWRWSDTESSDDYNCPRNYQC